MSSATNLHEGEHCRDAVCLTANQACVPSSTDLMSGLVSSYTCAWPAPASKTRSNAYTLRWPRE